MKRSRTAAHTILTAIRTMAAFVALVAQIGIAGAGVLDAREGASAASHLETGGTNLHFAHNEADCYMCRAQHLGDASPAQAQPLRHDITIVRETIVLAALAVVSPETNSNTSRAPPSIV
jgi:hypothetical protein